jgi:hypothetical protein
VDDNCHDYSLVHCQQLGLPLGVAAHALCLWFIYGTHFSLLFTNALNSVCASEVLYSALCQTVLFLS